MADPNQSTEEEEEEVEKLEKEAKEMCEKISEYRDNMPHQLRNTLTSFLPSPRLLLLLLLIPIPVIINENDNDNDDPTSSTNPISEVNGALVEDDPTHADKIQTIKHKLSSNASTMSSLLKRMKDCISRIDKLESFNKESHPAFKRSKRLPQNMAGFR